VKTAEVINQIAPDFLRVRTFVPKINTPLLEEIQNGFFQMLSPHEVLQETRRLLKGISTSTYLTSDHYTNYINLEGQLPDDTPGPLELIDAALSRDESTFRPHFVGTE
jgi:hypothetical protein